MSTDKSGGPDDAAQDRAAANRPATRPVRRPGTGVLIRPHVGAETRVKSGKRAEPSREGRVDREPPDA